MAEFHKAMVANLHGKPEALAQHLTDPVHIERARVYQNNRLSTLGQAIVDSFPAVARLVGDEFMRAMARAYVEAHPPRTPVLTFYGSGFPEFVDGFSPANSLPYLGDVARLDWAYLEAVFAPIIKALTASDLAGLSETEIAALAPGLHGSAQLLASSWNAAEIWAANRPGAESSAISLRQEGSAAVVWRAADGVAHRQIEGAELAFLETLIHSGTLGKAMAAAGTADAYEFFAEGLQTGLFGINTSTRGSHER